MRNLFDQYQAPENRLTHALGCCLDQDADLLGAFVKWATGLPCTSKRSLQIVEQQIPGEPEDFDEDHALGLPDLWIHDQENWSLILESKVASAIKPEQLRRHLLTAQRYGFNDIVLLVLSPEEPDHRVKRVVERIRSLMANPGGQRKNHSSHLGGPRSFPGSPPKPDAPRVVYRRWADLYCWMRQQARRSVWAQRFVKYLEIAEERMTADGYLGDQCLTEFDGIPFNLEHPYTYREAKRVLRLLLDELRTRKDLRQLGMDAEGIGRTAITGTSGTSVWDFLPLKIARGEDSFTRYPHLTVSIQSQRFQVQITVPHRVLPRCRRNLLALGSEGFRDLVAQVQERVMRAIRPIDESYPWMEVLQRHYESQRSPGICDAKLEFDLRTALSNGDGRVKGQEQWICATFDALQKKQSNLQMSIGAVFPYGDAKLHSRDVLDAIAGVWLGCKPWLDTLLAV